MYLEHIIQCIHILYESYISCTDVTKDSAVQLSDMHTMALSDESKYGGIMKK